MMVLMIGVERGVPGGMSTVVNEYYEAGLDKKIDLKYIPTMREGRKLKKLFIAMKAMIKFWFCVKKYEIVHVHMSSRASFYRKSQFIKVAHKRKKKIVIHMHGSEFDVFYDQECNDKQKKKVRDIFALADVVIALSEEWKEYLGRLCSMDKIIVLYNAVKIPDYVKKDYSDYNILFLGRLGKRKGIYDLLDVIPEIIKSVPDVHFYIGGDGEVAECKAICLQNGIQDYVTFLGWITGDKKENLLKKCSVFVLPSYHEGMPMALLEAMSYGEVVISTQVGGIPKVLTDNVNGYLIKAGDLQALRESLVAALSQNNRREIGENALKTIKDRFSIEKNIENLEALYRHLLEQ